MAWCGLERYRESSIHLYAIVLCAVMGMALGQPAVQRDYYDGFTRIQQDSIRVCVRSDSPTKQLDQAVAAELAAVLLLNIEVIEVHWPVRGNNEDLMERVFIALTDTCDGFMGFALHGDVYPDWLLLTRPYVRADYLVAVTNQSYHSLGDVPPGKPIGSQLFSVVDRELLSYLRNHPGAWRRFPYDNSELMVSHLQSGVVEAVLLFGPSLYVATNNNPEGLGLYVINPQPLPQTSLDIGIALTSRNSALVDILSEGLQWLSLDGTLEQLYIHLEVPGSLPAE